MPGADLTADPGPMTWSGWAPRPHPGLDAAAVDRLAGVLGPLTPTPPVALADVEVAPSGLTDEQHAALTAVVGDAHVHTDRETRVRHAAGRSYPDLVRLRAGDARTAPDAVVTPDGHDEVQALLAACARERIAVVPYGGGTSVVGGVAPARGPLDAVITLDLARMDRLLDLDPVAGIATFQPGVRGPAIEARLREHGLTLGHVPQSHQYASLGGYVATRSAGQASTGHGRIDDLVVAARCATPAGEVRAEHGRRSAAGPDLLALLTGSEGILGVLTEVAVRVRPAPQVEHYEAWAVPSFASGAATLRALVAADAAADVVRLSDEDETRFALTEAGGTAARAATRYLAARGLDRPCLLVLGWDGSREQVGRRRAATREVLRTRRAVGLGRRPGEAWAAGRFDGPTQRDDLLDHGVAVDTLETATRWSRLGELYLAVREAIAGTLEDRGTPPLVLCHVSHLHPVGASLYFTWLARRETDGELAQWEAVKRAATEAIVAHGGTITHHHAVGIDHRPWLRDEVGDLGVEVLRAVKDRLDPTGIMNPGKLLPPPADRDDPGPPS